MNIYRLWDSQALIIALKQFLAAIQLIVLPNCSHLLFGIEHKKSFFSRSADSWPQHFSRNTFSAFLVRVFDLTLAAKIMAENPWPELIMSLSPGGQVSFYQDCSQHLPVFVYLCRAWD